MQNYDFFLIPTIFFSVAIKKCVYLQKQTTINPKHNIMKTKLLTFFLVLTPAALTNLVEAGHGRWYLQHIPTAVPMPMGTISRAITPLPNSWPMTLPPVPVSTTCHSTR